MAQDQSKSRSESSMIVAGLEPAIFEYDVQRLVHWAHDRVRNVFIIGGIYLITKGIK